MSDQDQLLEKPIVIIGSPRSGTTVLGAIFEKHRSLAYNEEPRLTWRWGNDKKSDMLRAEDARAAVVDYIRGSFASFVREAGKVRLLEKTPSNALRMGFVDRVLPDCRFVHVIRNGYDSVLSIRKFWEQHSGGVKSDKLLQRLKEISPRQYPHYGYEFLKRLLPGKMAGVRVWGPRIPGVEQLVKDLHPLEVCSLQWRMCVEAACHYGRSLPRERYFECRLEDMDEALIRRIMDFCELDDDPAIQDYFRDEYDPSMAGARKAIADEAELAHIREWIEPTMKWLGYA